MKSHPAMARASARGPVPMAGRNLRLHIRSGVIREAHVVVTARPPAATATTPPTDATLRADRASARRRPRLSPDEPRSVASPDSNVTAATRAPPLSCSRILLATVSAAVVTAAAPSPTITTRLPYRP